MGRVPFGNENQPGRALTVLGLCNAVSCTVAFVAAAQLTNSLAGLGVRLCIVVICALFGYLVAKRSLLSLTVWPRRLGRLDTATIDPLQLVSSSGNSAADRGWNKLMDQAQQWTALSSLQRQLQNRLGSGALGDHGKLLDAIASAIAAVDAEGKITYANAMMAGICGINSPDQLLGMPLRQAMQLPESTADKLEHDNAAGEAEWSISDGDNSRLLRGQRRSLGERTTGSVWTIRDVTQQRLAESMREKFLTAATHEFRTPLANIRAYAESLDLGHDIDADARKHFYNVIQSESQRLSQLVDDLLDISRMQAGALSLDRTEVDLKRLVEDVTSKIQGQLQGKQLQMRAEFPPKFPKFTADKNMLSAAIVNLLGNAVKYTPEGGKVTFRVDINARNVQFAVSDTGIGIAAEEIPKVFERFFRSTDDRVQTISGSGLGLALVQEVARLHGGEVLVESVLNQGSTFRMVIPIS